MERDNAIKKIAYPPGIVDAVWDGKDSNGRSVSSGLYLYQLRARGRFLTGKMVLVK